MLQQISDRGKEPILKTNITQLLLRNNSRYPEETRGYFVEEKKVLPVFGKRNNTTVRKNRGVAGSGGMSRSEKGSGGHDGDSGGISVKSVTKSGESGTIWATRSSTTSNSSSKRTSRENSSKRAGDGGSRSISSEGILQKLMC